MSKQSINYGGEEHIVREDTAKSFRGVYWGIISLAAALLMLALLFFGGVLNNFLNGTLGNSPADVERQAGR